MKSFNFFSITISLSLFILFGCSSNEEPKPIDCSTSGLSITISTTNTSSCAKSDGTITANVVGGTSPYEFHLDGKSNDTNPKFTDLSAGNYILKVEDMNGCEKSVNVSVTAFNSTLSFSATTINSGCKTSNGSININATGGTGVYTYQVNAGTSTSSSLFSNLSAGDYTVKVTDDSGCSTTQTFEIQTGISYNSSIKNIIDTKCAVSGCHVSGGSAPSSFTNFANVQASASQIKVKTQNGEMPKNGSKLPQDQLDAIACWVDDGALDN
jgi:hypothetical protein